MSQGPPHTPPPPVIIKRPRIVKADGHHGGAWKVAYADFVTAMMAFFLLMWLLNATTEEQRKGIADYFNPSIPIAAVSGGGANALNGESVTAEPTLSKRSKEDLQDPTQDLPQPSITDEDISNAIDRALAGRNSELSEHVTIRLSPEGLVIELTDRDKRPLFTKGSAAASPILEQLSVIIADVLTEIENPVKIVGHTDALAFSAQSSYSNWELSTDRANTARRLMGQAGLNAARIREVSGKAATQPLVENPKDPRNRRISLTILRNKAPAAPKGRLEMGQ